MKRKISAALAALLLLVLAAAGCTKTEPDNTKTTEPTDTQMAEETATETAPAQETDAPSSMTGVAITEAAFKNEEGNYTITVPDSWIGKTSYEFDGSTTIIYHISTGTEGPQINPILLPIYTISEGEVALGEVFLEDEGIKYYTLEMLGLPYTEGSADAKEFAALSEEVSFVLENLSPLKEGETPEETDQPTPFTAEDTYFSDIRIGDAKEDVLAKVGEPDNSSEIVWEATGETRDVNEFSFGQLVFVDGKLVTAQITDDTYTGPRGIKVGMTIDEVAAMFASEKEVEDQATAIYYRANPGDDITSAVPPSAVLYKGDMQTLSFSVFTEESGAGDMTIEELKGDHNYIYMEQYGLNCEFDAQGVMLSFAVSVGTPSE